MTVMEVQTWVLWVTQGIPWVLFIWSEYLGVTSARKSNAVIDLLICGLERARVATKEPVQV